MSLNRRAAWVTAGVSLVVFVVLAAVLVPWDWVPGGSLRPAAPLDVFTQKQIARAEEYASVRRYLGWASYAVSLLVACVLGFSSLGSRLLRRLLGPPALVGRGAGRRAGRAAPRTARDASLLDPGPATRAGVRAHGAGLGCMGGRLREVAAGVVGADVAGAAGAGVRGSTVTADVVRLGRGSRRRAHARRVVPVSARARAGVQQLHAHGRRAAAVVGAEARGRGGRRGRRRAGRRRLSPYDDAQRLCFRVRELAAGRRLRQPRERPAAGRGTSRRRARARSRQAQRRRPGDRPRRCRRGAGRLACWRWPSTPPGCGDVRMWRERPTRLPSR